MFFEKDKSNTHYQFNFAMLIFTSIALTIPFVFYVKDIADSLRVIAEKRSIPASNGQY